MTGAAGGVGLALCEKLLACGAQKVVLADVNAKALLAQEQRLLEKYPGRVRAVVCDVSDEGSVKAMVAEASAFFCGSFDLMINCAGLARRGLFVTPTDPKEAAELADYVTTQDTWKRVFNVNFYGPLYACRAVLPIMLTQGGGQIINTISGTAITPLPYEGVYASAKAALNMMTLSLRYEYWDAGIKFNSASPGVVTTAIFGDAKPPDCAQSPEAAATRILTGAAQNDRLICGDDQDLIHSMFGYNVDCAPHFDGVYLEIARTRQNGDEDAYRI